MSSHRAERRATRRLPSVPVLAGVAVLAMAVGGVVTEGGAVPVAGPAPAAEARLAGADAFGGQSGDLQVQQLAQREAAVSRDSRREALEAAADKKTLRMAEAQARQRNAALAQFAAAAEEQAKKIALNAWVLPVEGYRITNTFGVAASYYASGYHTGLDFAVPQGTPIHAVTSGTITEVGYSGAYGNKTVETLEDGTELWYGHQLEFAVQPGQQVAAGEVIGYVGSTGNSFGAHVHLEVRPGAGDPVDPADALAFHGITP